MINEWIHQNLIGQQINRISLGRNDDDKEFSLNIFKDHETLKVEANNGWRIQDYQNIKGVIEDVQITFMNTSRPHLARLVALVEGKERIMVTFVSTSSANATQPFNVVPEPVPADS